MLIRPLSVLHTKSEPVFHTGLVKYITIGFKPESLTGFVPDTVGANDIVIIIMEDHCWIDGEDVEDIEDIKNTISVKLRKIGLVFVVVTVLEL